MEKQKRGKYGRNVSISVAITEFKLINDYYCGHKL